MRLRWNKGKPVVLTTERFTLTSVSRRWIARQTLAWTENKDVMAGLELPIGGWLLRRWRRQFKATDNRSALCLAIHEKQGKRLIGFENVTLTGATAFLSIVVGDTDWWGKGVVLETRAAVLDYLFDVRKCVRVWGTPFPRNFSSIYNYQRLGFQQEGILRNFSRTLQSGPSDLIAFSILPDEWRSHRAKSNS